MSAILTIRDAATRLDTSEATIRGLVRAHRIQTKRVPYNGNAKGLDDADMAVLARALGRTWKGPRSRKPAI